jgi:tetratricopeptide (TPR) repeat protein
LFDSLDKPMDAIRCMEQAMKLEPQNKLGWSNLASMVGRLGRHEKALEFADCALALDPQCVEAHLHRAAAAKALGKAEIVRETSLALATIEAEKFRRAR